MTQSPDAGEVHHGDCILFSTCRLSSWHTLEIPNSGPTIDNAEGQGRIQKELRSNKKIQISMFWGPTFESWPHFPLPFSSTLQPSQKCLTQIIVGTCFWGPGCRCWKPWQSSYLHPLCSCQRLRIPLAQDPAVLFYFLLRGDLCLFLPCARSYLNHQAHQHPFWFSFLFSRQLIQVAHFSKLYREEESINSCNCCCSKITVATIHWSFKPQTFLEAPKLLHFLTMPSLSFCSSLHLSPTDVPPTDLWDMPWSWGVEWTLQLSQTEMLQGQTTRRRNSMWWEK